MRATIDGIEIEGSPEEIAEFLVAIRAEKHLASKQPVPSHVVEEVGRSEDDGITERFAYRTLKRIPMSASQKKLLQTLRDSHPKWMLSSELQRALGWTPNQLGGVFGGLGRRLSATEGYISDFNLWDWKWDIDEGQYSYCLPDNVVAALARAGI